MLSLEITGKCPQKCGHCYGAFGPSLQHASWNPVEVLDEAYNLGFRLVQFIGGEVLTVRELPDYVEHAINLGYEVEIYSALMLPLNHGWRNKLLSYKVRWATSVYTADKSQHDSFVNFEGSFDALKHNISLIQQHERPIRLSYVDVGLESSLEDIKAEFGDNAPIRGDVVRDFGRGSAMSKGASLCGACGSSRKLAVLHDGNITSCGMSRAHSYGALSKMSLTEIWLSNTAQEERNKIRSSIRIPSMIVDCSPNSCDPSTSCTPTNSCWPTDACRPTNIQNVCDPQDGCDPEWN